MFPERKIIIKLWPFFVYKFLKGIAFITSITFFVFFTEKELDYLRISFLLSLLFITPVFFETITGIVADVVGRKPSVLMGIFFEILIISGIIFATTYPMLIILFFLWSVAITFSSGADDAWAIDSISEKEKMKFLDQYYTFSSSLFSAGMIVAGIVSSILVSVSSQSSIWVARIFLALLMMLVLFTKKEEFERRKELGGGIHALIWKVTQGFSYLKKNKRVKNVVFGELFITFSLVWVGSAALQPYLLSSNLPSKLWGMTYSVSAAFGIITPFLAMKLANSFTNKKKYLIEVLLAHGLIFIMASLILSPVFALFFMFAHNILEDLFNPVNNSFFQQKVPQTVRATLGSLQNTFIGIGAFLGAIIGGFFVNQFNPQISIALAALFLLPAVGFYSKSK